MRRLLKFVHTMGGIGLLGSMVALLVMLNTLPVAQTDLAAYVQMRLTMDALAQWVLLPSLGITIVAGLLSMAAVPPTMVLAGFGRNWQLAYSCLRTLLGIQGPMEREALTARAVLAGEASMTELALSISAEIGSVWVLGAVAVANVAWVFGDLERSGLPRPSNRVTLP